MSEPEGFLKRHGFLVAGVALPLLVVIVFVLARTLPRAWVADPRYDVVYGVRSSFGGPPRSVENEITVVDGRLRVRWTKSEKPYSYGQIELYRLSPASETLEKIPLVVPDDMQEAPSTRDLLVAGLEGFRVDESPRSRDGYEFDSAKPGGSGLLSELLVSRHRRSRSVIRKSGRVIVLPSSDASPYDRSPVEFYGWLVPVGEDR